MPDQFVAGGLLDGSSEGRNDCVDILSYRGGWNIDLSLDVPKGAFGALEGLHHVDYVVKAVAPANDKEGQDGLGVWSGLIPDPIGDQDAVEPVVGFHGEGGGGVLGRIGMAGFGHGGTMSEQCKEVKGAGTSQPLP